MLNPTKISQARGYLMLTNAHHPGKDMIYIQQNLATQKGKFVHAISDNFVTWSWIYPESNNLSSIRKWHCELWSFLDMRSCVPNL